MFETDSECRSYGYPLYNHKIVSYCSTLTKFIGNTIISLVTDVARMCRLQTIGRPGSFDSGIVWVELGTERWVVCETMAIPRVVNGEKILVSRETHESIENAPQHSAANVREA